MRHLLRDLSRFRSYYLLIAPALLIYLVIGFYPFVETFKLSFYKWDGISPEKEFVWFRNYWDIFVNSPVWWHSIGNAGMIALVALVAQNSFALLLPVLVDQQIQRGKGFYRGMFYL